MKVLSNKKIIITITITGIVFLLVTMVLMWLCDMWRDNKMCSFLSDVLPWLNITGFIIAMYIGEHVKDFSYASREMIYIFIFFTVPVIIYCLSGFLFILTARIYKNIRNISLFFFIVIMLAGYLVVNILFYTAGNILLSW